MSAFDRMAAMATTFLLSPFVADRKREYHDHRYLPHVGAAVQYGAMGMLDPRGPLVEAPGIKYFKKVPYANAFFKTLPPAFILGALVGWAFDPYDLRPGEDLDVPMKYRFDVHGPNYAWELTRRFFT